MRKKDRLFYSSTYLAIALTSQTMVTWYSYYYAPPGKVGYVNVAMVGYALLIGRIIDAIADPLVAYWSDNSTSKKGRRIPFIMYGSLPLVLSFILVWFPVVDGLSIINFYYLTLVMGVFFFFFTVVVAPYLALLPEITSELDERVTISTYQSIFNIIGLLLSTIVAGILIEQYGYKTMGVMLGVISLIFFLMPVKVIKEKRYQRQDTDLSFWDSIIQILKNKNFLYYQITNLLLWFGINMLTISAPYIGGVLMGISEKGSGLLLGGTFIVAIITSPIVLKLIHKYGKKKVFSISIITFGISLGLIYFIGRPLLFFEQLWYGYTVIALAGIPVSSIFIIPNAIIADITDEDQFKTGQKREAMYFGIQGLISKTITGISSWLTLAVLFNNFGYSLENPTGIYLTALIALILCIISFLVFTRGYNPFIIDNEQLIIDI